jgi:hypothetical protein
MDEAISDVVLLRQRPKRTTTNEPCVVALQNGTSVTATLRNVSDEGFCFESSANVEADDPVELRLLGVQLSGTIRWSKAGRAGGVIKLCPSSFD